MHHRTAFVVVVAVVAAVVVVVVVGVCMVGRVLVLGVWGVIQAVAFFGRAIQRKATAQSQVATQAPQLLCRSKKKPER